jgi:muramidase (phage lysozyme)
MATSLNFLKTIVKNPNIIAANKTVRHTEGTNADDGYSYLFGSNPKNTRRFTDFSKHPNIAEPFGENEHSTAAGAFQILYPTYQQLCAKYGFADFTPETQDLMFCAILDEINMLEKVVNGYFMITQVQDAMGGQWASLPLSKYGQPIHSLVDVQDYYEQMGGIVQSL